VTGAGEVDLSLLDELHDQRRRKLLADRAERELRIGGVRDAPLHVGEAISLLHHDLATISNEGRSVEEAEFLITCKQRVDAVGGIGCKYVHRVRDKN